VHLRLFVNNYFFILTGVNFLPSKYLNYEICGTYRLFKSGGVFCIYFAFWSFKRLGEYSLRLF